MTDTWAKRQSSPFCSIFQAFEPFEKGKTDFKAVAGDKFCVLSIFLQGVFRAGKAKRRVHNAPPVMPFASAYNYANGVVISRRQGETIVAAGFKPHIGDFYGNGIVSAVFGDNLLGDGFNVARRIFRKSLCL